MKDNILGVRLKQARLKRGLSQTEVFRRTNINNKTLSRYEKGGTEPDVESVNKLAELYEVNVDWLFGRSENPVPSAASKMSVLELSAAQITDAAVKVAEQLNVDLTNPAKRKAIEKFVIAGIEAIAQSEEGGK